MIITKIIGGLGNQMFQYAVGLILAEKLNSELKLDVTGYEKQESMTRRKYELGIFDIQENFASKSEIENLKYKKSCLPWILRKMLKKPKYQQLPSYFKEKKQFYFNPEINQLKESVYLEGYWQSYKYLLGFEDKIQKKFTLKEELTGQNREILNQINDTNSVSLHIRRGDYVTCADASTIFSLLSLDYYHRAIDYITKNVENPHFFIFSDEPEWAVHNLKLDFPVTIVNFNKGEKSYLDMILMSNCKHNIIANSSFSWWGAWLNKNPDKIVIAPKNWLKNIEMNNNDIIPDEWRKL